MGKSLIFTTDTSEKADKFINSLRIKLGIKPADFSDYLEIIPARNRKTIGIEEMRTLKHWAFLKPFAASNKLAVIRHAEKLTPEAQNSILKLLEEPSEQCTLLLITSSLSSLLPTIVSRCEKQQYMGNRQPGVNDFYNLQLADRFVFIDGLLQIKDKEEQALAVESFICELLEKNRQLLQHRPKIYYLNNIELLTQSELMLKSNVSLRLILENIVINLNYEN